MPYDLYSISVLKQYCQAVTVCRPLSICIPRPHEALPTLHCAVLPLIVRGYVERTGLASTHQELGK